MKSIRKHYRSVLCHKHWRIKSLIHCPLKAMKGNSHCFQWTLSLNLSQHHEFFMFLNRQFVSFAYRQTINIFSLWRYFKIIRHIRGTQTLISLTSYGKSFNIFLCSHPQSHWVFCFFGRIKKSSLFLSLSSLHFHLKL